MLNTSDMEFYAKEFLSKNFDGMTLDVPIEVNGRLTRSMGRFISFEEGNEPLGIELAKKMVEHNDEQTVLGVLYHELIHYALCKLGMPFDDSDKGFKEKCIELNVPQTGEGKYKLPRKVHVCECDDEKHTSMRKLTSHRCKLCKKTLKYTGIEVI